MRKLKYLTVVLALAALVLLGHPDTLSAQTLTFTPNPIAFPITGPGQTTSAVVTFSSSSISISSIFPASISTASGGNWLTATVTGSNTLNVVIQNTANLSLNTTYNGTIHVQANGNSATDTTVPVQLLVGATGGGLLQASPPSVSFVQNAPGSGLSQTISLSVNGSFVAATNSNFAPANSGVVFVNTQLSNGTVTLTVNNVATTSGTYTGTLTIGTLSNGSVSVQVTLTIGSTTTGLAASPNPATFNVQTGGTAPSQNVNITFNGSPVTVSSVSATSTPTGWLLPSNPFSTGLVNVGVNSSGLTAGTYTGLVTVNTPNGSFTFQVNLIVGGASTVLVNPTTVNFAYQAGTNFPLAQTITVTSNGNPVSFTINPQIFSGGSTWLVVSPSGGSAVTPSTITVSANPSGLAAGATYQGNIQLNTFGQASNPTINIPVNLLVSNNPILNASPAALSFTSQVGLNPPPQTLSLTSSSTSLSYTVTSTVVTPSAGNWLQVPAQSGATSGTVNVAINTQGLAVGTYTGNINIFSSSAGNSTVAVPVTLTVTAGSVLQLSTNSLNFAFQTGQAQPLNQAVTVSTTSGQLGFSVTSQINSGTAGWLFISPTSGTAPGNFIAGVNTAGLAAGTYTGSITVTPFGSTVTQTIQVTLVVSANALLVISPDAITFNAPLGAGSSTPGFQNVAVNSTDNSAITYTATASVTSGVSWLIVSPPSGTTNSNLTITANPNGLAVGTYTGTVAVTAISPAGVANSPRNISVTLNITPTATLSVSSNSLSFTQATSGGAPAPQTLTVRSVGTPITFNAVASTSAGGSWLTVNPSNATTEANLTVSVNGSGLLTGTYTGTILITSPGAANTQTVTVSLTISNAPTIVVSPTALTPVSFQIGSSANPAQQTIAVSLQNGAAATFTTSATVTNGSGWLSATPSTGTTPGTVTVTFSPAVLAAGTYNGSVQIIVAGATNSPVVLPITLTVTPAPVITPVIATAQNAASYGFTSVSPGMNLYIRGSNMGPAVLAIYHIGANGLLDTTVSDTTVTFDGLPSPIVYTSAGEVSVMVPYGVAGRGRVNMIVNYKGVNSAAFPIGVVDTSPALYTLNASSTGAGNGIGQGAILNANNSINSQFNPEQVGNIIQIYATGEGLTVPRGVDGAINPTRLPLPVPAGAVTVTIGGVPVPASDITYAGEAPGSFAGEMQINARIPTTLVAGPQPIFITVGGVPSQAGVIVNVRR